MIRLPESYADRWSRFSEIVSHFFQQAARAAALSYARLSERRMTGLQAQEVSIVRTAMTAPCHFHVLELRWSGKTEKLCRRLNIAQTPNRISAEIAGQCNHAFQVPGEGT